MNFLVILLSILCFQSAFSEDITPSKRKKKERVLILSRGKSNVGNQSVDVRAKKIKSASTEDEVRIKINLEKYSDIFKKKVDFQAKLRIINKDIEEVKQLIAESQNDEYSDYYQKSLYELKFRRTVINLHLKNYGKSLLEAKEIVAIDESYLFRKSVLYFNKKLTLDDTISSTWYLFNILEKYSCKDSDICKKDVEQRYSTSWYKGLHDYSGYELDFFNNNNVADIKTVIESYTGFNSCVGACLIGRNIDDTIQRQASVASVGASSDSSSPIKVPSRECDYFEDNQNLNDRYQSYLAQLISMTMKINDSSVSQAIKTRSYLCRGFTNVMMLELGPSGNEIYIADAKSDIKNAIAFNNTLSVSDKLDEIDDIISLDALVGKYNTIITKGMTDSDKALAQYSISEKGLSELKASLEGNSDDIEEFAQISESLSDEQKADISAAYSKYSIADASGDVKTQTAKFMDKSTRLTEIHMESSDVTLEEMLNAIIDLQKNGDL